MSRQLAPASPPGTRWPTLALVALLGATACTQVQVASEPARTRADMAAEIQKGVHVVRTRNVDEYLSQIPDASLFAQGDSATGVTTMHWDRLVLRKDRTATDNVISTFNHREIWRRTPAEWRSFEVISYGGQNTVNGKPAPVLP